MIFEMDLLENSYDYLFNALEAFKVADENGTHDQQRSDLRRKKKWKIAFVFLMQATELLIKESLRLINPVLVYDNIDLPITNSSKTVTFSNSLKRLQNFYQSLLDEENIKFLTKCAIVRNEYIHFKVKIETPQLKSKFCKLYVLYIKIHEKVIKTDISYSKDLLDLKNHIINFNQNLIVFRGEEFTKERLEIFKEELALNKNNCYFIDKNGTKYLRIKFGSENDAFIKKGYPEQVCDIFESYEYCADCSARKGEYHLDGCDWEICPICLKQVLSCDCEADLCDEEGNIYDSPYMD